MGGYDIPVDKVISSAGCLTGRAREGHWDDTIVVTWSEYLFVILYG